MKPLPPSTGAAGAHPSRFSVARYLAGDTPAEERAAFEAHVSACPECAALLGGARNAHDTFAAKYPSLEYLRAVQRARHPAPVTPGLLTRLRGLLAGPVWKPALAAFAIALIATVARFPSRHGSHPDLSAKGAARFRLSVDGKAAVADTVFCKPGDTLQLGIVSGKPVHYAVYYRDDDGPLQAYMADGQGEARGGPQGQDLPHSLVLDAGWKRERIYCLWSAEAFDAQTAQALLVPGAVADERASLHLRSFLILRSP